VYRATRRSVRVAGRNGAGHRGGIALRSVTHASGNRDADDVPGADGNPTANR
jgi:hypothetical protein